MHGNSKTKLLMQLLDAQRGLRFEESQETPNAFMLDYYRREVSRLMQRVYR